MRNDADPPLAIVGNLNVDQVVAPVARFPDRDEELLVDEMRIQLAGTAGYLLLAARGLGIDPVVVSTIGDDLFGIFILNELERCGIDRSGVEIVAGDATSVGVIFVHPDGGRSILSQLGAHARMDVATAERHDAAVAACREVFLCGNYLLPRFSPGAAAPYARMLRARGQTVIFDPSWDPAGWGA